VQERTVATKLIVKIAIIILFIMIPQERRDSYIVTAIILLVFSKVNRKKVFETFVTS
jgi:hypothetical protein